jgi:uncharacterized protein (DUF1800 family)
LLHAIAIDPAMLIYLDGTNNAADALNENFGREVMELFTLGRGNYTEDDVVAASRAFTGWIVLRPGGRAERLLDGEPWSAQFIPFRHDAGTKTLLGTTGNLDSSQAIEVLLEQDATASYVAGKLFNELVGWWPDDATTTRIAAAFRDSYAVVDLVEAIVTEPVFLAQSFGLASRAQRAIEGSLRTMSYVPFVPPNVAGYPQGTRLLDPHRLIHTFDLVSMIPDETPEFSTSELMARLGLFDISTTTRGVLDTAPAGGTRISLAINSPEFHVV